MAVKETNMPHNKRNAYLMTESHLPISSRNYILKPLLEDEEKRISMLAIFNTGA